MFFLITNYALRIKKVGDFLPLFKKKNTAERPLPRHIAIVMDGNGRWAKKRGLPRSAGHVSGAKTFKTIARYCNKIGLEYLTVYAFSTENWKRPPEEVEGIMNLLRDYLKDAENFKQENIKVKFIGAPTPLADDIKELMKKDEDGSKDATGLKLNIAINYGGRDELVHAVKKIIDDKSKYTDYLVREDIKANLQFDLAVILDEYGYPPVTIDDVYKEVLEQAENFKKYAE